MDAQQTNGVIDSEETAALAPAELADAVRVVEEARAEADALRQELAQLTELVEKMTTSGRYGHEDILNLAALYRYTPGQHDVACMMLVCYGYNEQEIADALDISLDVFRMWRRRFPSFRRAYERGRMRILSRILLSISAGALKGKFPQAQFLLERADARFRQHVHQHVEGSLGGVLGGVSDEDIEARVREVSARITDESRDA